MCEYCDVCINENSNLFEAKKKYRIPWAEVWIVKAKTDFDEWGNKLKKGHYYLAIAAEDYGLHEIYDCPNCGRKLVD